MIVTFFGHKDAPDTLKPAIKENILLLLDKYPDCMFYVGNNGRFDKMVISVLTEISENVPDLSYAVILAYLPKTNRILSPDYTKIPTIFPNGIESVPKKFAIPFRNDWMVKQTDITVCYITRSSGSSSARFVEKIRRKKKEIINLADNV